MAGMLNCWLAREGNPAAVRGVRQALPQPDLDNEYDIHDDCGGGQTYKNDKIRN
jgi:hypothetical protein